jgi:hypothetical protein
MLVGPTVAATAIVADFIAVAPIETTLARRD